MRKICVLLSFIFLAVGLVIFVLDEYTNYRYGFHMNEVAAVTDDGNPIGWPTGERPAFTLIPMFGYALGLWLAAAGLFWLPFEFDRRYQGRICRGTE